MMLQLALKVLAVAMVTAEGPCDILGAAGNPCVAAHSTVRALFANYTGPLYTLFHNQSNKSIDINALKPGGFADVVQHEALCPNEGECVISRIVDQSGNGNTLAPRDDRGVPGHGGKQAYEKEHCTVNTLRCIAILICVSVCQ